MFFFNFKIRLFYTTNLFYINNNELFIILNKIKMEFNKLILLQAL